MSFRWLKPYMPRSLYGRVVLILLLPVITLFLVVSVLFVQRHFEGVTTQMTRSVSREIQVLREAFDGAGMREVAESRIAQTLEIDVQPVGRASVPPANYRRWYDLTGSVVIRELHELVPGLIAVELPDDQNVHLFLDGGEAAVRVSFDRRRVSASNPHQLFVYMIVVGAVITIIAYLYLRNQLRPITRLAHAAEAFGRGRHIPYQPAGAIEVRAAGNAFLDMRARIERQIEQRTLMLSGVSHDLRTPLTRLRLELSLLDEEARAPMLRDIEDMERLLDAFLAFARGAQDGEPEPVDPGLLLRAILEDCERAAIPARLVQVEGAGQVPLRADAIRRAVENLINNAVRYGTRAEVSMMLSEKTLRIRVEDDGPGIPPERREEAAKPFARLEPARNQNRGTGVGLGLSIATDIARAHGGSLRLSESRRLGGLCADIVIAR